MGEASLFCYLDVLQQFAGLELFVGSLIANLCHNGFFGLELAHCVNSEPAIAVPGGASPIAFSRAETLRVGTSLLRTYGTAKSAIAVC